MILAKETCYIAEFYQIMQHIEINIRAAAAFGHRHIYLIACENCQDSYSSSFKEYHGYKCFIMKNSWIRCWERIKVRLVNSGFKINEMLSLNIIFKISW